MGNASNIFGLGALFFSGSNGDFATDGGGNLKINSNVTVSGFTTSGINTSGFRLNSGNPVSGKVLTATDTNGNAAWISPTFTGVMANKTVTGSYSVLMTDAVIFINSSGSGNLPVITCMPASQVVGQSFFFKKVDYSSNITLISGSGSQLIDGASGVPLIFPNQAIRLLSDGTNYNIL